MPIPAECGSCHKRFKANDKLAGKKVKCPQCGGVIEIAAPAAPRQAAPAPPKEEESDVYGVADDAPAVAPAPPPATGNCPSCGSALLDNAVLCVLCGYDLRTGKQLETQQAAPDEAAGPKVTLGTRDWAKEEEKQPKTKKKRRKKRSGELHQGLAFLRGCAVSFGCALIGSFMWFGLAVWLDIEMGIIAWVLGGLAGVGMMIGYGVEDVLAGLAAAGVALVAIFVAKVMIIAAFLSGAAGDFMDEMDMEFDEAAQEEFAGEEFDDEEEFADEMASGEEVPEEGMASGEEMSDEEEGEELTPEELAAMEEEFEEIAGGVAIVVTIVGALVGGLISMFFPLMNILFLIFACGTAYKVGSGGGWLDDD